MPPNPEIENQRRIWLMALGYFAFYIPYSALTKALSLGLLPGMSGPVSGFLILPATAIATSVALIAFITIGGGWGSTSDGGGSSAWRCRSSPRGC